MLLNKICAINLYFFSSVLTTLLNKELIYILNFKQHYLLTTIQSIIICCIIYIYCMINNKSQRNILYFKELKHWFVTGIFLTGMIISNIKAISYLEISIYTIYKNCGIVVTAIAERIVFKKHVTRIGFVSFIVIIVSTYLANIGFRQKQNLIPVSGYLWMVFNILVTTAYVIYMKHLMHKNKTKLESVFFTNFITIPILGAFSVIKDERGIVFNTPIIVCIIASSILALLTAISTAWTLKIISSTTYSMLGASNKLLLSACAIFWFKESKNATKLFSLFLGIAAGFVYSYNDAFINK